MGDKALRGNRLTAQGGGHIAGPARRAQEHGFYSPDMGMRGRFAIGGAAAKAAKIIKKKLMKPRGVFKVKGSKTHGKDVPTMAAEGGRIGFKKGGTDKNWIQKAVDPKHKGFCTPMTKKTCTPRRKALARTFKKMGRERKAKG